MKMKQVKEEVKEKKKKKLFINILHEYVFF